MKTITFITGASSGIGMELSYIAAGTGRNVALVARNKQALETIQKNLGKKYPEQNFEVVVADLSKPGEAAKAYEKIAKNYRVDRLINNAGFGDFGEITGVDSEKTANMIRVNVEALTELARKAAIDMKEAQHGRILNVASVAGFLPGPYMAAYYATKAYVLSFSEAIAEELKPYNITVTALCPGATRSNFDVSAAVTGQGGFKNLNHLPSAKEVAEFGWEALEKGTVVAVHGRQTKLYLLAIRLLPRSFIRRSAANLQRPTAPKKQQ